MGDRGADVDGEADGDGKGDTGSGVVPTSASDTSGERVGVTVTVGVDDTEKFTVLEGVIDGLVEAVAAADCDGDGEGVGDGTADVDGGGVVVALGDGEGANAVRLTVAMLDSSWPSLTWYV